MRLYISCIIGFKYLVINSIGRRAKFYNADAAGWKICWSFGSERINGAVRLVEQRLSKLCRQAVIPASTVSRPAALLIH